MMALKVAAVVLLQAWMTTSHEFYAQAAKGNWKETGPQTIQ